MKKHLEMEESKIRETLQNYKPDSGRWDEIWENIRANRSEYAARGRRKHMEKIIVAYTCVAAAFVLTFTVGAGMGAHFSNGAQPEGPGTDGEPINNSTNGTSAQDPAVPDSTPSPAYEEKVVTAKGFILRLSESGDAYYLEGCSNLPQYLDYDVNVVIPSSYNGLPVTKILRNAFEIRRDIESVVIPDSVTEIDELAFEFCNELTSVTIPDSVTEIGDLAFEGCRSLTSILIPDRVTKIGYSVFGDCYNLTSATLSNNLTEIPNAAFIGCIRLADITIPDGVTKIGLSAFTECEKLTSITIPASVTEIGAPAFMDCPNLTDIYFSGTVEQWKALHVEDLLDHPCTLHIGGEEIHLGASANPPVTDPAPADPDAFHPASWVTEAELEPEEKTICNVTLEDDFASDSLIVVLSHAASIKFHEYGVEDFPEIDAVSVHDLLDNITEKYKQIAQKENAAQAAREQVFSYNQTLVIKLSEKSKENVLNAIRLLEQRDDVISAEPEFFDQHPA